MCAGQVQWALSTLTINTLRSARTFISRSDNGRGLRFHFMFNESKLARMLEAVRPVPYAGNVSLGTPLPQPVVSSIRRVWIEWATT